MILHISFYQEKNSDISGNKILPSTCMGFMCFGTTWAIQKSDMD